MPEDVEIITSGSPSDQPRPEPDPAPEAGPVAAAPSRRRWVVPALLVWAVLATVAAVVLATWWAPLHSEGQNRRAAEALASDFAVHLTTFDGEHIDAWVDETQAWATGTYAQQLTQLFDPELRAALREAEVSSQGTVLNLFVQEASGDEATVFAVVVQQVENRFSEQPFSDELRMEITLQRDDGDWLVSDVAVLGPGGLGLGPGLEEAP
jgi:Mce-associated membrane protein